MHSCTVELDPRAGIKYGMSRARVCKTGASKNERIFLSYDAWILSLIFFPFFGGANSFRDLLLITSTGGL